MSFEMLREPFHPDQLEFKVEVKSKDGQKGQASTYVDPRRYQERLDDAFGPENWDVEYRPLGANVSGSVTEDGEKRSASGAVIARLTIRYNGQTVVREEVGEFGGEGKSQYPTATAQAFKRACAAFGLGRYLYFLPKMWGAINQYRQFEEAEIERFKKMCPAPAKSPQNKPQATEKAQPARTYPQGQESVQQAKAVARLGQLLQQADDMGAHFSYVPENWRTLGYQELVQLGQRIGKDLADMKE
jgi:hypothetical protein